MILLGSIILEQRRLAKDLRRAEAAAKGLCPTCGYDMRASNGKCPECGEIIPEAPLANPIAPAVERIMLAAINESRVAESGYVGSEHVLLALIHEKDSLAETVLRSLDVDERAVRDELARPLGSSGGSSAEPGSRQSS